MWGCSFRSRRCTSASSLRTVVLKYIAVHVIWCSIPAFVSWTDTDSHLLKPLCHCSGRTSVVVNRERRVRERVSGSEQCLRSGLHSWSVLCVRSSPQTSPTVSTQPTWLRRRLCEATCGACPAAPECRACNACTTGSPPQTHAAQQPRLSAHPTATHSTATTHAR